MSAPAGWYPDPADAAARRWWDGTQWTAQTAPAPRFGEYAPMPAAPVPQAANGHAAYPATPTYAAYPATAAPVGQAATPAVVAAPTNTIWVWLAIASSVLPLLSFFLIDWNGYVSIVTSMARGGFASQDLVSWQLRTIGVSLISWLFLAAFIVFSWLDWRELKRRGIVAPFGWAWSFFVLISLGSAVYMIGRAAVLARRTVAGGWAPLWAWIAGTAVSLIASISVVIWLVGEIVQAVSFTVQGS